MGDWAAGTLGRWGEWKGCVSSHPKGYPRGVRTYLEEQRGSDDWSWWVKIKRLTLISYRGHPVLHASAVRSLCVRYSSTRCWGVCSGNLSVDCSNGSGRAMWPFVKLTPIQHDFRSALGLQWWLPPAFRYSEFLQQDNLFFHNQRQT